MTPHSLYHLLCPLSHCNSFNFHSFKAEHWQNPPTVQESGGFPLLSRSEMLVTKVWKALEGALERSESAALAHPPHFLSSVMQGRSSTVPSSHFLFYFPHSTCISHPYHSLQVSEVNMEKY